MNGSKHGFRLAHAAQMLSLRVRELEILVDCILTSYRYLQKYCGCLGSRASAMHRQIWQQTAERPLSLELL